LKAAFAVVATGTAVSTMDRIHIIPFCGMAKGFFSKTDYKRKECHFIACETTNHGKVRLIKVFPPSARFKFILRVKQIFYKENASLCIFFLVKVSILLYRYDLIPPWRNSSHWVRVSLTRLHEHTQHTTLGRTPLDEL